MVLLAACGGDGEEAPAAAKPAKTTTTPERDAEAFEICKGFVKDRLKAPSTAKFRNFYEDDGEVLVTGFGNGPYEVVSTVDAENSFGGKLRNRFTCSITLSGGTWTLNDISIV